MPLPYCLWNAPQNHIISWISVRNILKTRRLSSQQQKENMVIFL